MEKLQQAIELPVMLKATDVAAYLRIRRQDVYQLLLSRPDFPRLKLSEKRTRIPREAFLAWVKEQQTNESEAGHDQVNA